MHRMTRLLLQVLPGLLLAAASHAAAPVRGGDDTEPLEFASVAEFVQQLSTRKDVVRSPLPTPPGMTLLQTSSEAVSADPNYAASSWVLFTAPHALAPSVVRMRTQTTWNKDAPLSRSRKVATLCEGSAAVCAALELQSRRLLAAPL